MREGILFRKSLNGEFKLDKASENIEKKIKAARLFPFAVTLGQVDAVARSME